jgi:hypothetical protein
VQRIGHPLGLVKRQVSCSGLSPSHVSGASSAGCALVAVSEWQTRLERAPLTMQERPPELGFNLEPADLIVPVSSRLAIAHGKTLYFLSSFRSPEHLEVLTFGIGARWPVRL